MIRIVKKPEERRREIVKASRELFLANDYENTTMQDVIQKLNIAKGTAYHYFKSKAELLDAVVDDMVGEYLLKIQETLKHCHGNALDKMRVIFAASQVKDDQIQTLNALHRPGNSLLHTRLLAITLAKLAPLYVELITQGCEENLFRTDTPLESVEFILAAAQFLTDTGIYPWSQEELIRRKKAFPQIIEQLLQAPRGSFNYMDWDS